MQATPQATSTPKHTSTSKKTVVTPSKPLSDGGSAAQRVNTLAGHLQATTPIRGAASSAGTASGAAQATPITIATDVSPHEKEGLFNQFKDYVNSCEAH